MGEVSVEHVAARVHGRYLVRPANVPHDRHRVLFGFHGFAENARTHMEQLESLPGLEGWDLVAVQALHPFYIRSGAVVAGWMTRQDRELAIADNVAYVRTVIDSVVARLGELETLSMIGFSQGTAMAYRAAAGCGRPVDAVIALGGDVPPELEDLKSLPVGRVLIGRGLDEDWYDTGKLASDRRLLSTLGIEPEVFEYAGGHEWTEAFREAASRFLFS